MPNRIIKESVCSSDSIDSLSWFEEVVFYRLIVNCDDYGRMDARPAILRSRLFPLKNVTDKQIQGAIQSLRTAGIVLIYEVDSKPFLQLRTWEKHQQIRAKKSKYPSPDMARNHMISDDIKCPRNPIQSESNPNPNNNNNQESTHVADVVSAYLDRVNPSASQTSLEELACYATSLGRDVCIRAIDIALDERKATWSYIRAILRDKQSKGIKCLADWDREEAKRSGESASSNPGGTDAKWGIQNGLDNPTGS